MGGGGFADKLISASTFGTSDLLGITEGFFSSPFKVEAPTSQAPTPMEGQTGNILGGGSGKTLDLTDQDKQRGSISKKRLGTRQLQIPLANQASAGVNVAPTTGVNV